MIARLALALSLAACGADTAGCPPVVVEPSASATAADVQAILARDCAVGGCHLRAPGAGDLVLESTAWRDAMIGVPAREAPALALVAPGDPDHSWLALKITGTLCAAACDPALGCGDRMPFGQALSDADRATIVAWIAAGAR